MDTELAHLNPLQDFYSISPTIHENFLGKGADSIVYRQGEKVVKFYVTNPGLESLERYKKITNEASDLASDKSISLEGVPVKINPINSLFWSKDHKMYVSVSDYIEGENMADSKENKDKLRSIADNLNRALKVRGISLLPVNVKMVNGRIVITDICSFITELQNIE